MTRSYGRAVLIGILCVAALVSLAKVMRAQQQEKQPPVLGATYLYIGEYEVTQGRVPNEAIAEATEWVRGLRKTGEFKSVRLYIHNTGPRFALYIITESSWAGLEAGWSKFFAGRPDIFSTPFRWGAHSDNLLSEITVP